MSALLENMMTWYETSCELLDKFKKNPEETRYLRSACNHLQQTSEFALKGALEKLCGEYAKGHDLEENGDNLIDFIKQNKENVERCKEILDLIVPIFMKL